MAIQYILALNRQGKVRISKWFSNASQSTNIARQHTIKKVHRLISSRDILGKGASNMPVGNRNGGNGASNGIRGGGYATSGSSNFVLFDNNTKKLVYRRYNGLFFIFCIELNDNELYYLELIQFLVEILDEHFDSVCELDLVFNFYQTYLILDEIFLNGELYESSKETIINRLNALSKLD